MILTIMDLDGLIAMMSSSPSSVTDAKTEHEELIIVLNFHPSFPGKFVSVFLKRASITEIFNSDPNTMQTAAIPAIVALLSEPHRLDESPHSIQSFPLPPFGALILKL